jgi:PAS domain S-box-containing protein
MSALAAAVGVTALLGWYFDCPGMTQWMAGRTPIVYNTALSLVLLGAALLASNRGRRPLATALAILGGLPSCLTLFEYVAGVTLGIDELMMKYGYPGQFPGRMAPNATICLLLLSAAILCMRRSKGDRCRTLGTPLLASVAMGISAVTATGYLTGFSTFGWGRLIPMALPAAVGVSFLSLAALCFAWGDADFSESGVPSWLHLSVGVATMVVALSVWQALASEEQARIGHTVAAQLEVVRVSLLTDMDSRIAAVERFARRWERTRASDRQQWEFEAGLLLKDVRGFQAIGWADPAFRVRWGYPQEGNAALLGAALSSEASCRTAVEMARSSRRTIITRPIRLATGGDGFHAYVPVYKGPDFRGVVVATFRFQDLFQDAIYPALAPGYALGIYAGDEAIYLRAPQNDRRGKVWEQQASLQIENERWTLKLWPARSALAVVESSVSKFLLVKGLLLSVLLAWAVYLAQAARVKTRLAERARGALEQEVAERRRAKQELDQFFALIPDMLCVAGFDGYFKRVNAAWERTLGMPVDSLLAEPFATFVHPDDLAATERVVQDQKNGIAIVSFENRYRAQDGSYCWLRWNAAPVPERQLIFAAARDVTSEKCVDQALRYLAESLEQRVRERTEELERANRALHESEELFRRMFDEAPVGAALVGLDHRFSHVNKALCALLDYEASELRGFAWDDITHSDDRHAEAPLLEQTMGGRIPGYRLTKRCLRKSGEIVWADLTTAILRDERGTPITLLAMVENVTERRHRDEQIARLNRELEARVGDLLAVNQELESFNYSVSHDLRAPLRHIDGFSRILLEEHGSQIAPAAQRYLDLICGSARRMGRMVDELLELSRTSRIELARQPTMLKSLVDDVLEELRPELRDRHIDWHIGDLPFVYCDPNLTRQVFANLLSNAVKFSRPRNPAVIEVGQTRRQGEPVLFVRDNGVGFCGKYADKLFGVFQRLHRREDFEGTGVGLATVQRIVHKHGGRIWAEAELDKGATFYFTLDAPEEPPGSGKEEAALVAEER